MEEEDEEQTEEGIRESIGYSPSSSSLEQQTENDENAGEKMEKEEFDPELFSSGFPEEEEVDVIHDSRIVSNGTRDYSAFSEEGEVIE